MFILDFQHPIVHSPSIPNSLAGSSLDIPYSLLSDSYDVPDPGSSTRRRTVYSLSSSPSYMPASSRISLVSVFQEPRILANFLRYIKWHDFRSLALTCTACRNVLHHPKLRNVVLSAFVPGFRYCLRHADLDSPEDMDIQFHDLNDFMISQRLSLHLYPTHALTILSSRCKIPVLEQKTNRYVTLCQAHSRMVLLLQALIHSASSPVPEDLEDPSLRYRGTSRQRRELVFPAPLSLTSSHAEKRSHASQWLTGKRFRFFSLSPTSRRPLEGQPQKRSLSFISLLGKNHVPPPPPSAEPLGLKIYSGSWRGRKRAPMVPGLTSSSEENQSALRRASRNLTNTTDTSLSSADNSPGSSSPNPSGLVDFVPVPVSFTSHAPHDIRTATSRLRAPILRVYFPCSEMDHHAIAACEEQLEDAGLWHHLSVGDVVCNLGFLPPKDKFGSTSGDRTPGGASFQESWMIFDGTALVPYTPSAVLPLSDPLSLPSPLYYAHVTRPPLNPRFIAVLPREDPELSLVFHPVTVRSPHSPNGFVRVKKYVWLARLGAHVRPGLGEGWNCEWILEGGGTKEGRQSLLDALQGNNDSSKREWELVMEESTATRVWLRLTSNAPPTNSSSRDEISNVLPLFQGGFSLTESPLSS